MKKIVFFIMLFLILVATGVYFISQSQTRQSTQSKKTTVAASFYPLYYFASEIGKEKADVFSIVPNGVEPHDFEPTPQDITSIQKSKLLIINGTGFEPWIGKMQQDLKDTNIPIITTTDGLNLQQGQASQKKDPHVWLSPILAKTQVDTITKGFIQIDPQNQTYYEKNANALKARLDELNTKYQSSLRSCQTRSFVTSHAAFAYLATTYHLNQVSIAGLSPETEPSTAKLAEVTDFVKKNNVKYIFFETLVSPELSDIIAKETGARTLVLDPIEGIPNDKIKQGENYFTVMEANLKNLQKALACTQ